MNWTHRQPPRRHLRVLRGDPLPSPPPTPEPTLPGMDRASVLSGAISVGIALVGIAAPIQVYRIGGVLPWSWGPWLGLYAGALGLGIGLLLGLAWGTEMDRRAFWAGFGAPLALGMAWATGVTALGYGW